jgi:hypothetical protein
MLHPCPVLACGLPEGHTGYHRHAEAPEPGPYKPSPEELRALLKQQMESVGKPILRMPDEPSVENERWWQAFCCNLSHASAIWTEDSPAAKRAADVADAAIAEAKKRGRL